MKNFFKAIKLIIFLLFILIIIQLIFNFKSINDKKFNKTIIKNNSKHFKLNLTRPKYNISCKSIFELDLDEIEKAKRLLESINPSDTILNDKNFIFDKNLCGEYKNTRFSFNLNLNVQKSELEFPLAYSILTYNNVEQLERLLALIYRPHNIYCIHVDLKSSDNFKKAVKSITDCFDNIFISSKLEYITYGGYTRLKADLNCLNDLLKSKIKWKYFMNMASSEFPLRTNYELTKILRIYNESNEVEIIKKFDLTRIKYKWKLNNETNSLYLTKEVKSEAPHGFRIVKGYAYCVLSRRFTEYIANSNYSRDLLEWSKDTWSPDEWYWSTLQYNTKLFDSGFKDDEKKDRFDTVARFAGWGGEYNCKGKWRNGVCVFSLLDLPEMISRPNFIVNKFLLDYDPISYQCMEEWFNQRQLAIYNLTVDIYFYCKFLKTHSYFVNCPNFV